MPLPSLIDLRWLSSHSGTSSVARHVLNGLRENRSHDELVLWGDPVLIGPPPPNTTIASNLRVGREWYGQRDLTGIPPHENAAYLFQIRPLRDWNSATGVYDTIQLRNGGRLERAAKARFLRTVVRRSRLLLTISDSSRRRLINDLGAKPGKIRRLHLPLDVELARLIRERRAVLAPGPDDVAGSDVLMVSRADRHKNHEGLVRAFARSGLNGVRRLHLFGPAGGARTTLEQIARDVGATSVEFANDRSDDALVDAYARAAMVVLPSFDEGWGLPIHEAIAAGIPVVASDAGALPEVVEHAVGWHRLVDVGPSPTEPSVDLIEALEAAPTAPTRSELDGDAERAATRTGPTPGGLAGEVLDALAELRR